MASNPGQEEERRDSMVLASFTPFIKRTDVFPESPAYIVYVRKIPYGHIWLWLEVYIFFSNSITSVRERK